MEEKNIAPVTVDVNTPEEGKAPEIKNVTIEIEGRRIPLRYTTTAMIAIEEEMDMTGEELREELNQLKKKNTKKTITALRILGNEGLRLAGEKPDLTDEYLLDRINPREVLLYRVGVMAAILKGMLMETDHTDEEKQDVVLNEILKKNSGSQPAG